MPLIQPPVTDEGRWYYRGSINYSPSGTSQTGLKVFPPSFTSPLLRIRTIAGEVPGKWKRPPEHWFLAGNLSLVHGTFRDSRTHKVPLNADSLYWLDPLAVPYQVGFDAVDWLPVLEVRVFEWAGEIIAGQSSDFGEITAQLETLGEAIALLAENQAAQNTALAAISQQVTIAGTSDPATAITLLPDLQSGVAATLANPGITQLMGGFL